MDQEGARREKVTRRPFPKDIKAAGPKKPDSLDALNAPRLARYFFSPAAGAAGCSTRILPERM